jgi:hypothetical protein
MQRFPSYRGELWPVEVVTKHLVSSTATPSSYLIPAGKIGLLHGLHYLNNNGAGFGTNAYCRVGNLNVLDSPTNNFGGSNVAGLTLISQKGAYPLDAPNTGIIAGLAPGQEVRITHSGGAATGQSGTGNGYNLTTTNIVRTNQPYLFEPLAPGTIISVTYGWLNIYLDLHDLF